MTDVISKRRVLSAQLTDELGSRFVVARNPDHPFLLQGPDLLVGGEGKLTAIFLFLAAEVRKPDLLEARFLLSRLALPNHAQCVLMVDPQELDEAEGLARNFHEVILWQQRMTSTSFVRSRPDRVVPTDVSILAQRQFASAMNITALMQRITADSANSRERPLGRGRGKPHKETDEIRGVEVAFFRNGRFDAQAARDLVYGKTLRVIGADDGIPYFRTRGPSLAVLEYWPDYARDPNKIIRAAAFAGWSLTTREDLVDEAINRIVEQ